MSNENLDRSNPTKFIQYMRENPFYFEDIFKVPFSMDNTKKAITELRVFVGKPEDKKETARKPERAHRRKIVKQSKDISKTTDILQ